MGRMKIGSVQYGRRIPAECVERMDGYLAALRAEIAKQQMEAKEQKQQYKRNVKEEWVEPMDRLLESLRGGEVMQVNGEGKNLDQMVTMRMRGEEKVLVAKAASEAGKELSEWMREVLLGAASNTPAESPPSIVEAPREALGFSVIGYVKKIEELTKNLEAARKAPDGRPWPEVLMELQDNLELTENQLEDTRLELARLKSESPGAPVIPTPPRPPVFQGTDLLAARGIREPLVRPTQRK